MAKTKLGLTLVKTLDGSSPAVTNLPLASGTYYVGTPIRLSGTSGSGVILGSRGTAIAGVLAAPVTTAQAITGDKFPVYLPDGNNVFEVKMLYSAAPQTKIGEHLPLVVSTANWRMCSTAGTAANNTVTVVGFNPDEAAAAATGGLYWVTITRSPWAQSVVAAGT